MQKDYLQSSGSEENEIDFIARIMMTSSLAQQLAIGGPKLDFIKPIHKRQGILRSLHYEFGLSYDWFGSYGYFCLRDLCFFCLHNRILTRKPQFAYGCRITKFKRVGKLTMIIYQQEITCF